MNDKSKNRPAYFIFCAVGMIISFYFIIINFADVSNEFKISIDHASLITGVFIASLYAFSRKTKTDIGLSSDYKLLPSVVLTVLFNYFLLYENGDMNRAIASGIMVFATAVLVSILAPNDIETHQETK